MPSRRTGKGGSLVYPLKPIPDDFELRFEWKVAPGSNSGVYYRPTQYEFQILDNQKHADGKNPRTSAASLYFCMPPSHDATRPVGQWNTARVVCKGTVIQHWLNGEKVIDFDYTDPKYAEQVKLLKLRGGDLTARGEAESSGPRRPGLVPQPQAPRVGQRRVARSHAGHASGHSRRRAQR